MAKYIVHTCDRCGCKLNSENWQDDNEICNSCIQVIEAAQTLVMDALIQHKSQPESLTQWARDVLAGD
ncbi:MAG: hypothetical protein NW224_12030 [Leptolyngbyaceae cyanobacterium bins.302]|nr:hypothetical protein [Leptolyngbyaceae cyanobacterium bins.302]